MKNYEMFIKKYSGHSETPWCYYQIANIHKNKRRYKLALDNYRIVIDRFPESYWSTQAKWKKDDAIWQNEYKEVFN